MKRELTIWLLSLIIYCTNFEHHILKRQCSTIKMLQWISFTISCSVTRNDKILHNINLINKRECWGMFYESNRSDTQPTFSKSSYWWLMTSKLFQKDLNLLLAWKGTFFAQRNVSACCFSIFVSSKMCLSNG